VIARPLGTTGISVSAIEVGACATMINGTADSFKIINMKAAKRTA
jgi:hypothetical protein